MKEEPGLPFFGSPQKKKDINAYSAKIFTDNGLIYIIAKIALIC